MSVPSFFKNAVGGKSKAVLLVDSEEDDVPLRTARAAAAVKPEGSSSSLSSPPLSTAKRGGELFVKIYHVEKVGKETEVKKERMKFSMDTLGKDLREAAIQRLRIRKPEKLVPYFVSGGVYMDLSRTLDQYVMGITETIELRRYKHPRGKVMVILYELGRIETVDVWSNTTVHGVLMAIVAKNENTVNDCVLCSAEPDSELPLDYVIPKSCTKLVFLKRSRVGEAPPERPVFPSRAYLEEMASRTMNTEHAQIETHELTNQVNTMWVPPPDVKPPKRAPAPEESKPSAGWTKSSPMSPEEDPDEPLDYKTPEAKKPKAEKKGSKPKIDLSSFDLTQEPKKQRSSVYLPDDQAPSSSDVSESANNTARKESNSEPSHSPQPESKPDEPLDVVADIQSIPEKKYERLIYYLDQDPVPQPRQCAALFKDWFSNDPVFKAYFSGLGVQRAAEILKVLSKALQT